MTTQENTVAKKTKNKGPIRWEGILPFTIVCTLIGLYFHFFFDAHLRRGLEWVGYNGLGSEVNIASLETSFFKASLRIQGIEITDADKPEFNSVKIGDIRFSMLWDALLRAKIVINEAAVEQIEFGVKRKHIGKVKPPDATSKNIGLGEDVKKQALAEAEKQSGENVLGDIIALLGGSDSQTQLNKLQESLPSKDMLTKLEQDLNTKKKDWNSRLKNLPQNKDIQALSDRLNKVKTKNFKTPQELQTSLQQIDRIAKDGDSMLKDVQGAGNDLKSDLKSLETQYKAVEQQIKTDIKTLEQHFKIPKLDAKSISQAVFSHYLSPYKAKFQHYKSLVEKYIPPNLKKKGTPDETEIALKPHPREVGTSYEFGRPNSYPLVWVKRTAVSSQAGLSPDAGNIKGEILNLTSHQALIGKPTIASLAGDFPAKELFGFLLKLTLDNTKTESVIDYLFKIESYTITEKNLIKTPDVQIAFNKARGNLDISGKLLALKEIHMTLNNKFNQIEYNVSAKNEIADQILKTIFAGIPVVTLSAEAKGILPNFPMTINSNLGPEIRKGFEKQLQAKIDEARKKIESYVNEQIGSQKARIESEITKLKGTLEKELKKAESQLNEQKKLAESRIEQSKKDAENQARKQLEKEGKKAVDDLKKKLGF